MDARNWLSGFLASQDHFFGKDMKGPLVSVDLPALGPDLGVPIFIFQGTEDDYTPFELAKEYADFISAPDKQFVPAPGGGHYAAIMKSRPEGAIQSGATVASIAIAATLTRVACAK